jgi:hypothetical protein
MTSKWPGEVPHPSGPDCRDLATYVIASPEKGKNVRGRVMNDNRTGAADMRRGAN